MITGSDCYNSSVVAENWETDYKKQLFSARRLWLFSSTYPLMLSRLFVYYNVSHGVLLDRLQASTLQSLQIIILQPIWIQFSRLTLKHETQIWFISNSSRNYYVVQCTQGVMRAKYSVADYCCILRNTAVCFWKLENVSKTTYLDESGRKACRTRANSV